MGQLDAIISQMVEFLSETPFASVAMAQGGDHVGGQLGTYAKSVRTKRKAMNTFVCSVDREFQFIGRINEDVNTYTASQRAGLLFLTFLGFGVEQMQSQSNAGGMTDLYLDSGTYIKSFYTIMYAPSCTIIDCRKVVGRLHHRINWNACAPCIIREKYRKARRC